MHCLRSGGLITTAKSRFCDSTGARSEVFYSDRRSIYLRAPQAGCRVTGHYNGGTEILAFRFEDVDWLRILDQKKIRVNLRDWTGKLIKRVVL